MSEKWETRITKVEPDNLTISGYPLQSLVESLGLLDISYLLVTGELPSKEMSEKLRITAIHAAKLPAPDIDKIPGEDISKSISKCLLLDDHISISKDGPAVKTAFALGRAVRFIAHLYGHDSALSSITDVEPFSDLIFRAFTGQAHVESNKARLLEAMVSASVDHGVTPPSAQATLIAASTRAAYEVCLAQGVGVITDVHGGAGAKAAFFFRECTKNVDCHDLGEIIKEYSEKKKRIPGLGHRVHHNDPRRDVLWKLAAESGATGPNVEMSKAITSKFKEITGKELPINVDGVIGAIVADLGLETSAAKAIFIFGRIAGLSAHYFEELGRPVMRKIDFTQAVYSGPSERPLQG